MNHLELYSQWHNPALGEFTAQYDCDGWQFDANLMPTMGVSVICARGPACKRGDRRFIAAQMAVASAFLALVADVVAQTDAREAA